MRIPHIFILSKSKFIDCSETGNHLLQAVPVAVYYWKTLDIHSIDLWPYGIYFIIRGFSHFAVVSMVNLQKAVLNKLRSWLIPSLPDEVVVCLWMAKNLYIALTFFSLFQKVHWSGHILEVYIDSFYNSYRKKNR